MFTCPVSGIYVITVSVTSVIGYNVDVQIMRENVIDVAAFADNDESVQTAATTTSVMSCDAGERIWIRTDSSTSRIHGHGSTNRHTSIAGFLL